MTPNTSAAHESITWCLCFSFDSSHAFSIVFLAIAAVHLSLDASEALWKRFPCISHRVCEVSCIDHLDCCRWHLSFLLGVFVAETFLMTVRILFRNTKVVCDNQQCTLFYNFCMYATPSAKVSSTICVLGEILTGRRCIQQSMIALQATA